MVGTSNKQGNTGWKQGSAGKRIMALRNWDSLSQPKKHGVLVFRRFKDVNISMLEKLGWIFLTDQDRLCSQVLRSKYRVQRDWLRNPPPSNCFPDWKGIEKAKLGLQNGVCFSVGNEWEEY